FFFFSSRRRHTRWPRDWSSDVCSSDLFCTYAAGLLWFAVRERDWSRSRIGVAAGAIASVLVLVAAIRLRDDFEGGAATALYFARSEERRVGKEWRCGWAPDS